MLLPAAFSPTILNPYLYFSPLSQYITCRYGHDVGTAVLKLSGEKNTMAVEDFLELLEIFLEGLILRSVMQLGMNESKCWHC